MTIKVGDVITYSDLVDLVLTSIKNRCQNIGELKGIPPTLTNASYTINGNVATTLTHKGLGARVFVNHIVYQNGAVSYKVSIGGNNPIKVVQLATIRNQLNEFLKSRGIAQAKETVMTQRGILNFFVNVASFVKTKVVMVGNDLTQDTAVVYVEGNNTIPHFPRQENNSNLGDIEPKELSRKNVEDMIDALSRITNYHQMHYNLTVNCCSSSSSSSSSSCSSSSSSSFFIAYLMI